MVRTPTPAPGATDGPISGQGQASEGALALGGVEDCELRLESLEGDDEEDEVRERALLLLFSFLCFIALAFLSRFFCRAASLWVWELLLSLVGLHELVDEDLEEADEGGPGGEGGADLCVDLRASVLTGRSAVTTCLTGLVFLGKALW